MSAVDMTFWFFAFAKRADPSTKRTEPFLSAGLVPRKVRRQAGIAFE